MRRVPLLAVTAIMTLIFVPPAHGKQPVSGSSKDLKIKVIDVEGGAAALFLTPEGKSLLIDTGWPPGFVFPRPKPGDPPPPPTTSSADRIAAAAAAMGITRIDYLAITHYHGDHLGGLQSLLEKLPVDTFIDHGPNRQPSQPNGNKMATGTLYDQWVAAYKDHPHITAHAGEKLNIGSLEIEFIASDGKTLSMPLPGAGDRNNSCARDEQMPPATGEDVASMGVLMTFGNTRILDLGDLTWDVEQQMLCPVNKIGKVDVYFVPGHGNELSNISATEDLHPLVALLQNGSRKGGDPEPVRIVDAIPGLKGFWRLHANALNPDLDGDPDYIANLNGELDRTFPIDVDIDQSGKITVTNPRNDFTKSYQSHATAGAVVDIPEKTHRAAR